MSQLSKYTLELSNGRKLIKLIKSKVDLAQTKIKLDPLRFANLPRRSIDLLLRDE